MGCNLCNFRYCNAVTAQPCTFLNKSKSLYLYCTSYIIIYGGIHIVCPIVPVIHWRNKPNHWGNQYPQFLEVAGPSGCVSRANIKKCRFMDKRVREMSHFFAAPPRVFPLSVRARVHALFYPQIPTA